MRSYKTDHDILRDRILARAFPPKPKRIPNPSILRQTEKSDLFEELLEKRGGLQSKIFYELRMNRKIMANFRYNDGEALTQFGDLTKSNYDRIRAIRSKCDEYDKTGNLELMVDIGNYAEIEFVESRHPLKHFKAQDDSYHCEVRR